MYTTWKWSTGESYYKSARAEKEERTEDIEYNTQQNAINQSLEENSFFNQELDITNSMFSRTQNVSGTRREDLDTKIADREMIAQRGVNPFLQTSYVNDVVARDMYLKPINTTFDQIKEET